MARARRLGRPQPPLPSCLLPITLSVGFSSPSPPPRSSGAAQRQPIRGRQLRPVLAKQPLGWDGARTRLGIWEEVGFSWWRSYSSRRLYSASAPPPGSAGPFPHLGADRAAARGIVGVVVPECGRGGTCFQPAGRYFWSGRRRCAATRGAARFFFRIGRGVYQSVLRRLIGCRC